jgi:carboxylesterase type B
MMHAWVSFARNGKPGLQPGADWSAYDGATRNVMVFGESEPRVEPRPDEGRRLAWATIPDALLGS